MDKKYLHKGSVESLSIISVCCRNVAKIFDEKLKERIKNVQDFACPQSYINRLHG